MGAAAAAAKSLQSCLTLCNPIDGSPPGSPVPGILQARTLEWVDIRSIQISAYKEQRGFLEGKSFQEKELDMKRVDETLVTESKGKSAFSMVPVCRLISCKDKRTHICGSNVETPVAEWNQNRGRVGPLFELNTTFWQLLDTSSSTRGWVKSGETGRSEFSLFEVLANSAGAFRRLLCLSEDEKLHGNTGSDVQH